MYIQEVKTVFCFDFMIRKTNSKNLYENTPIRVYMNNNEYLDQLEAKSIYIIREAYRRFRDKLAALVSWGKDSTTMLYLVRKSFFGKYQFQLFI